MSFFRNNTRLFSLLFGPVFFLVLVLAPSVAGMDPMAQRCAAITIWMAAWWIFEPVHTSVTSLLPLVLFPLCGILKVEEVSAEYGDKIIFLFIAGFFFGKTIEHWGLHRRIALLIAAKIGGKSERLVLAFILSTALISMWISNTATAVMMTPVAAAVAANTKSKNLQKSLLLSVGYACSIGGLGTLIGTPTNAIGISYMEKNLQLHVTFGQWFLAGFPLMLLLIFACWFLLLKFFPLENESVVFENEVHQKDTLAIELAALGSLSSPEKRLLWLYGAVVFSWISGSLLWYRWLPACNDTVVAIAGAILLFLIPAASSGGGSANTPSPARLPLLTWPVAVSIPWGIVILFGGGLALAKGIDKSGFAAWLGHQMQVVSFLPSWLVVPVVLAFVVLLSEVASNIATAAMMMPVLAAMCAGMGLPPEGMLLGASMAASFGFGMPVAAAANSIVYGTGYMRSRDMMRVGFVLDLVAVLLLSMFVTLVLPSIIG